eukprot:TRINITY_DN2913_c0_g1_i5.p1 TRINITY_DN2913_c0_g1~~TRINITY_DN2913_c0_g1_i5.p1  ORF type:complete len:490 (-),score=147.15 TRINITY_DN2913_c0_g1_i5:76-1545(-)
MAPLAGGLINVLSKDMPRENFHDVYILGQKIGQTEKDELFVCNSKKSGTKYCCKIIRRRRLLVSSDVENVRTEFAVLHHLAEVPNIIKLHDCFEDDENVYAVTQFADGADLFSTLYDRANIFGQPYSEQDAAEIMKLILGIVANCHRMGVLQGKVEPESFYFSTHDERAELMMVDFSSSKFLKLNPEVRFTTCEGRLQYMAPEKVMWLKAAQPLLEGAKKQPWGKEVDVWSAGVLMYCLLCGYHPFTIPGKKSPKAEQISRILKADVRFDEEEVWGKVSDASKDLIKLMLTPDPSLRPTAVSALGHPWLNQPGMAKFEPLPSFVYERLKNFASMQQAKRLFARVLVSFLQPEELEGLVVTFKAIDQDSSGTITISELREALQQMEAHASDAEIEKILSEADLDKSGEIEYEEFIAAMLRSLRVTKKETLLKTFNEIDKDGSGQLTEEEISEACKQHNVDPDIVQAVMDEADQNKDGCIDYMEFIAVINM